MFCCSISIENLQHGIECYDKLIQLHATELSFVCYRILLEIALGHIDKTDYKPFRRGLVLEYEHGFASRTIGEQFVSQWDGRQSVCYRPSSG